MIESEFVQNAREGLEQFNQLSPKERFLRLQRHGLIDAEGKTQAWDAFLAVVAVRWDSGRAVQFRCRQPVFSMLGTAEIDVSRESMTEYLKDGRRIISAPVDAATGAITEGEELSLTSHDSIRTDANDTPDDNLGNLPSFTVTSSRL